MNDSKGIARFLPAIFLSGLVACASTPTQEGAGEYIDDSVVTGKVKAAIVDDPQLKATEINVETFKGIVQLSGFVAQPADIQRATEVAKGVGGVKSVKNVLHVK